MGMIIQFVMTVIIVVAAFLISTRLVRPFHRLTKSMKDVQDGYEEDFISINTYSETDTISQAVGEMLHRMQSLDATRQEFVSNVSHELKTPLTSMKVLADSLIGQENVPVELYREFMTDIGAEIDRENKIITDLLSLVKMDKSAGNVNIESVNINDLLELIMKRLKPIAQKQNVELVLESFRPVTAEVDEVKLTLALSNLVENAIKYNKPEGWVHVTLNADHQNFFVTVEDSGIGIPEDSQAHIFERFYRVDKSHSREIGGTGLGLAITRSAIIMHRGAIKVHSVEGEGTTFTVRIPLTYIAG
ncbi:MAG: HAMP domain-containing sensor histidine kinase [Eubacterium sp.]